MNGFTALDDLLHRKKGACHVVKHFKKKKAAKKAACAMRVKGTNARVGGSRGKYSLLSCGRRKKMGGRRKK